MLILIAFMLGYPSITTGSGALNIYSARTLPAKNISVHLHASDAFHAYNEVDSLQHHFGTSNFGIGYGITDYIEGYIGTTIFAKGERRNGFDPPEDLYYFADRDVYGGIKFYLPIVKNEDETTNWLIGGNIGSNISLFPRSDMDDSLCLKANFEPTFKHKADFNFDLLSDIELYPLYVHLNMGYCLRRDYWDFNGNSPYPDSIVPENSYFLDTLRSDAFRWGAGFQIAVGKWTRFILEGKGSIPFEEDIADTSLIGLGIRFITPARVTFDLGVDYMLSDADFVNDWVIDENGESEPFVEQMGKARFKFGFTTTNALVKEKKPKKPEKGIIALTVRDIKTDEPLDAIVSFQDTTLGLYKTGKNGNVSISLKPGNYHMKVDKEGYIPRKATITVKSNAEVNINTVLREEKKAVGKFTGTISSYREGKPLAAEIEFLGTELKSAASDAEKGVFKVTLPEGTYNVKVSSDGYIAETFPIEIKEEETTVKNVKLMEELKEEKKLVLHGIHFASGKSSIPPDGFPILNKVAEVLKANENVKVEISGHTDAVGSASYNQRLSEARARSVRQYLIQQGIDPARLVAKGYGESSPIAPNTTREGRAKNRRIEFSVISR